MNETMSSMYISMRENQLRLAREEANALAEKVKRLQARLAQGDPVVNSMLQGITQSAQELTECISKVDGMDALFRWSDDMRH